MNIDVSDKNKLKELKFDKVKLVLMIYLKPCNKFINVEEILVFLLIIVIFVRNQLDIGINELK